MVGKEFVDGHLGAPIIQGSFQIHKMPGKGGWSFVGVVNVSGTLDSFQLAHYGLMPMKNGRLFLAIRAAIRKEIGKQEGDWVEICLYAKNISSAREDDLLLCLQDEPKLYERFSRYSESERQAFMDWVNSARGDEQRASRIAEAMDMIAKGLKRR